MNSINTEGHCEICDKCPRIIQNGLSYIDLDECCNEMLWRIISKEWGVVLYGDASSFREFMNIPFEGGDFDHGLNGYLKTIDIIKKSSCVLLLEDSKLMEINRVRLRNKSARK